MLQEQEQFVKLNIPPFIHGKIMLQDDVDDVNGVIVVVGPHLPHKTGPLI